MGNKSGARALATRRTGVRGLIAALTIGTAVATAAPAYADAVTVWNDMIWKAVNIGRPGAAGFVDAALVHAAIHDAVQSYEGRFTPYHVTIPNPAGSPVAALAAAAHEVLVGIYPAQKASLDNDYNAFLTTNGLVNDPGLAVGHQVAVAILPLYRALPNPPLPPYTGAEEIGAWRPTPSLIGNPPAPPSFSPMATFYLVFTEPFALMRPSQFRPEPPPPLKSERYRREYDEVKAMGARFSSVRTAEQTDLAYFYSGNIPLQMNAMLRAIAETHLTSLGDSARLLTLANIAGADAVIACWEAKYHYSFWRPITAIREGNDDSNPGTVGDANWEPLINTPNYPDYVSGANSVAAAVATILSEFFGTDDFTFTVTTGVAQAVQKSRVYTRFSGLTDDMVNARIWLGIHFRSADEDARQQGSRVAHWVFQKTLRADH